MKGNIITDLEETSHRVQTALDRSGRGVWVDLFFTSGFSFS